MNKLTVDEWALSHAIKYCKDIGHTLTEDGVRGIIGQYIAHANHPNKESVINHRCERCGRLWKVTHDQDVPTKFIDCGCPTKTPASYQPLGTPDNMPRNHDMSSPKD